MRRIGRTMQMNGGYARPRRGLVAGMLAGALGLLAVLAVPGVPGVPSASAQAPVGQGFNLNRSDLRFILQQIKIAENHVAETTVANAPCGALLGPAADQIPDDGVGVTLPWGLRTVDGTCNNLLKDTSIGLDQNKFGAADQVFPREVTPPQFRPGYAPTGPAGPPVQDPEPRRISNLIVDQSPTNPAAVEVAGDDLGDPADVELVNGSYFIPNVATDVGLSAPYNSWFTLFGQFFDHGLDLVNKGGASSVFVPLDGTDPLQPVPAGTPPFMILTRASQVNGEATNQTTPFVDQSQTYTSHPSHQVFLRDYDLGATGPVITGRLITGPAGGMGDWNAIKAQARNVLGIELVDTDVFNVPLIAADLYGHFIPDPDTGFPQLVLAGVVDNPATPDDERLVSGTPTNPVFTTGKVKTGHAFLDDIAHHATPGPSQGVNGAPGPLRTPDADTVVSPDDHSDATYDDELLAAHFVAGDGRVNENIGLTTVHHIFHSEHNRLVGVIDGMLHDPTLFTAAELADWQAVSAARANWTYNERLFQAARFVTEMQYQHLAFEEFVRKVQPMVNLFGEGGTGYHTEINPAIRAEFAHAVYRFGHSMLTETVDRTTPTGANQNIPLLDAFLNPPAFMAPGQTPENAAGNVIRGMTRQIGNELDEFVTGALRNRLLGLPLDLATLNIARARDTGIPSLNAARRDFYAESGNPALAPYTSWADFGFSIRNRPSLVNFIAAYGTHTDITTAVGPVAKRAAAQGLLDIAADGVPEGQDAYDFLNSTGLHASPPSGITTTGVDDIDLWMGGLAEKQMVFGGLLGPTFNYVFENQMENLQDGDRFYYLSRTAGLNMLTQLEGNSFSELIMRNTDVEALPADSFSRPCVHLRHQGTERERTDHRRPGDGRRRTAGARPHA